MAGILIRTELTNDFRLTERLKQLDQAHHEGKFDILEFIVIPASPIIRVNRETVG
ncbi:MAG: hypothetical protein GF363_13930 [Chitinivibrionales bacterium]|nr:hypothetical protein [Chitinivibrionales bacterium]